MPFILITGASRGIGKAIAEELARRRFNLLLVARSGDLLKELAADLSSRYGITAYYLSTDLSSESAAEEVHAWTRQNRYAVNGLVNNAGYGLSGRLEDHNPDKYSNMIRLHTSLAVGLCRLFLPELKRQPRSYIMNISSTAAYQAIPYFTIYAASKAFLLRFSRGLHQELKGTSVSVTCISPGYVDTTFLDNVRVNNRGVAWGRKTRMSAGKLARISVRAMLNGRIEVITGAWNRLMVFCVWLLPKMLVERVAGKIYKPDG